MDSNEIAGILAPAKNWGHILNTFELIVEYRVLITKNIFYFNLFKNSTIFATIS
jgi:hypothetical protein